MIASGRWNEAAIELTGDVAYDAATSEQLRQPTRHYWLGMLHVLLDAPGLAYPHAEFLCSLDPIPVRLQALEEGALLALEIGDSRLASKSLDALRFVEKNWFSTHSRGARVLIEGLLSSDDPERAQEQLIEAKGLWPDPIALYSVARFQNRRKDFESASNTLTLLEEARGRAYRLFFPGLVFLGRIERARALAGVSRFEESFRLYRQVMKDLGNRIPPCSLKNQLIEEYRRLTNTKE
jgi:tetratricopeptide (TPR) repeat protein